MSKVSPEAPVPRSHRRLVAAVSIGIVLTVVVTGLVLAWYLFFGSEAPPAPTIDDAVRQLLPSAPPQ